jgi:hypothetical protein
MLLTSSSEDNLELLTAQQGMEYAGERCSKLFASDISNKILKIGDRNFQNVNSHHRFKNILQKKIEKCEPFSMVRLGDGEGNILFWYLRKNEFPELADMVVRKIMRIMFGRKAASPKYWDDFADMLYSAANNAAIVGLPTDLQIFNCQNKLLAGPQAETHFDVRGSTGVIATWDWASRLPDDWWVAPDQLVVNWHIHKSLIEMTKSLVSQAPIVSAISCYPEMLPTICQRFSSIAGLSLLIPPQASNISGTPDETHYPDVFNTLREKIQSSDLSGHLFLIGAGLLGKVYCELVRQSGGMAIDVGSMMDVWVGKGVRGYQNEAFVEKYRL